MGVKNELLELSRGKEGAYSPSSSVVMKHKFSKMFVIMREVGKQEERIGLHASSVIKSESEFCYRQQVLSLFFKQDQGTKLPPKLLAIFSAGESIHEKWQTMLEKCNNKIDGIKLIKNEDRSYSDKYDLLFTPDSVIEYNHKKTIVEYKSMNDFSYKKALKSKNPHPSARKQIQIYMFLKGYKHGIILLENKNTQEFEVYDVDFNYEEALPFILRLNEIQVLKKEFETKKKEPPRKCKNCSETKALSCNMRSACFNTGIGRIKL